MSKKITQFKINFKNCSYVDTEVQDTEFKLLAIVNHIGRTTKSGHYTTLIRSADKKTHLFDDEDVSSANVSDFSHQHYYGVYIRSDQEMPEIKVVSFCI